MIRCGIRNRLAEWAVLLAIAQAAVPVPRQAANVASEDGHHYEQESERRQDVPNFPSAVFGQIYSHPNNSPSTERASGNKGRTIGVSELAAVKRDIYDWILLGAQIGLVSVGFFTLLVLARQNRIAKDSAVAAKLAAEAARHNIDLLIRKERPRISVRPVRLDFPAKYTRDPIVHYKISCSGVGAAYLIDHHAVCEITAAPAPSATAPHFPMTMIETSLHPQPEPLQCMIIAHMFHPIRHPVKVEPDLFGKLRSGALNVFWYGAVKYRHVYSERVEETVFSYRWAVVQIILPDGSPAGVWERFGENRET